MSISDNFLDLASSFRFPTDVSYQQWAPAVTGLVDGSFVVVWEGNQIPTNSTGIHGQRFLADGSPVGQPFTITNTNSVSLSRDPAVIGLASGGFAVAWSAGTSLVEARVFDSEANPVSGVFRAPSSTGSNSRSQVGLVALEDGNFLITWLGFNIVTNSSGSDLFARRFTAEGSALEDEFVINSYLNSDQTKLVWTPLSGGGFVAVWTSLFEQNGSDRGVSGRVFGSDGRPAGPEFKVNTFTNFNQDAPRITALEGGGFVVVWTSVGQDGSNEGVFGQRFDSSGGRLGQEFQVNVFTHRGQVEPVTAALDGGGFIVVWASRGNDELLPRDNDKNVYARIYNADGTPNGGQFRVNNVTFGEQKKPDVVALQDGTLLILWETYGYDLGFNDYVETFSARRFLPDGTPVGPQFVAQDGRYASGGEFDRVVTLLPNGDVLVAWDALRFEDETVRSSYATLFSVSSPYEGGARPLVLVGTPLSDTLEGLGGNDTLSGLAGNDNLFGGGGDDVLDGGIGNDRLDGGEGSNLLQGDLGNDRYVIRSAADVIEGEVGFSQGGGIDTVEAWISYTLPRNVEILRLQGTDNLNGTGGAAPEALVGNSGANDLRGNGGNDVLNGKAGDDTLIGGTGADSLVGEGGADVFVFTAVADSRPGQANRDFINGFERGIDRIDLSLIDANSGTADNDAFTFIGSAAFSGVAGQLRFFTFGGGNFNIVEADVNGDRVADMQIFVNLTNVMVGADFVL